MELYQLRSFVAVADTGNLTRAAERLHHSQPALSAQIKALEDTLGVQLFRRAPSGMALTRAGRALLADAVRTLAAAEELRRAARTLSGHVAGRLRIGTVSDPGFIRLGEFLALALERFPQLELELHHEVSGAALEAVQAGRLDASFYFGALEQQDVAGLALTETAYRVAAPATWKARVETAGWKEIAELPWILTPPISTHSRMLETLFAKHGVSPARIVEADNESVIASLVASGLGVSLLHETLGLRAQAAGQVCLWSDARLTTTLWFVTLEKHAADPAIAALRAVLQETWRGRSPRERALAAPV
ncbi:MAG: LysR family transcriptional regulator [Burkholderiales bacterium]|nr:LysR family transcriptional regulator [Burkholderiales bacterium]